MQVMAMTDCRILLMALGLLHVAPVSANPICLVAAVGPIMIYDPASSAPTDGIGSLSVTCTYVGLGSANVSYQMRLSTGLSNVFFPRKMNFLIVNMLNYNIYTNPTRTTVWGDGTGGTAIRTDSYAMGAGVIARNYDVYFRIPASQQVAAGAYVDTINVTLMY